MKRIKKKLLPLALALAMCLGMCQGNALTAQAAGPVTWLVAPGVYGFEENAKFSDGLMPVKDPNTKKWGYINTAGQLAIPCQYGSAGAFQDGVAIVNVKNNTYAHINTAGQMFFSWKDNNNDGQDIKPRRSDDCHEGMVKVYSSKSNGKIGFMNAAGQVVIPCQYDRVGDFSDGLAAVHDEANNYWGYIDKAGNVALPFQYKKAYSFVDGYAPVQLADGSNKVILIDKTGRNVIPEGYKYNPSVNSITGEPENIFSDFGGYVRIYTGDSFNPDGWFLLDKAGGVTGPLKQSGGTLNGQRICPGSTGQEGLFWGNHDGDLSLLDAAGRELWNGTNARIQYGYDFSEGYAVVCSDYVGVREGFVDQTGNMTLLPEGVKLADEKFSEGFLPVYSSATGTRRFGFVNTAGQLAIPCTYKAVGKFSGGVAPVMNFAGQWGLVDATGAEVLTLQYDVKQVEGATGIFLVKEGGKYGLVAAPTSYAANGAVVNYAAQAEVNDALNAGIATEALGGDYRNEITRAQLASEAVKLYEAASGQAAPAAGASPFSDVNDPAVTQAQTLGLIDGLPDGTFIPNATVPKEQAAAILSNVTTKVNGADAGVKAAKFEPEGSTRKTASIEETLATATRILKKIKK